MKRDGRGRERRRGPGGARTPKYFGLESSPAGGGSSGRPSLRVRVCDGSLPSSAADLMDDINVLTP